MGLAGLITAGCATGTDTTDFGGSNPGGSTSTSGTGGAGGVVGGCGEAGSGNTSMCGVDCSSIQTPDCQVSVCNEGRYRGTVGVCVVVPDEDGTTCEDGLFCTVQDGCVDGICAGGPENDCGMTPGQCMELYCDEQAKSCGEQAAAPGASCQDPNDLCMKGATCNNGLCTGGSPEDCFFFPVPDDCHVAECNPQTGQCEAVVGNEGGPCADLNDLCTVNKICTAGVCGGGVPKDCTHLTVGCFDGVCNVNTGVCEQQAIAPGQQCAEATDQCNQGICDTQGNCNGQPANEGQSCDDNSYCSLNDICVSGTCTGTTMITQCTNGDFCCPNGCTIYTDTDCNPTMHTLSAVNRGWWKNDGAHTSGNNNTLTGQTTSQYNSYFSFDLSGLTGTVLTAELHLEIEDHDSVDGQETVSVWDVSTPAATLEATGNSTTIFNDLMSGNQYGTFTVLQSEVGSIKVIPLNSQALTDINAALGTDVSVGCHVDSIVGSSTQWVRFSMGSEARTHQLVLGII